MDYSVFISRFLGIAFTAYGLGLLINREHVKKAAESMAQNPAIQWAVTFVALFWGSYLVVAQQIWTDWSVTATLAGWLVFLTGLCRAWMPDCFSKCFENKLSHGIIALIGFIFFAWGVIMMFYGFFGAMTPGAVSATLNITAH